MLNVEEIKQRLFGFWASPIFIKIDGKQMNSPTMNNNNINIRHKNITIGASCAKGEQLFTLIHYTCKNYLYLKIGLQ